MTWLILALIAPLLWSIANYFDKYILSKVMSSEGGSGGLIVLSSFMSLVVAGILFIINGNFVFTVNSESIFILILSGFVEALYIFFYFKALELESTSTVIALFQFSPVFGLIFGYFLIHEIPTSLQLFAMFVILIGTLFLVVKKGEFHLKAKIVKLMTLSTLFIGLYGTLFKMAGETLPLWVSIFWQYLGIGLAGIIFYIYYKKYRKEFKAMTASKSIVLVGMAEVLNIGAVLVSNMAFVLAPVALVLSISSVQPLFVLVEGLILALVAPRVFKQDVPKLNAQYLVGIGLVIIGGFLIY